jgi:putative PEP-CTERM system histidine kinase
MAMTTESLFEVDRQFGRFIGPTRERRPYDCNEHWMAFARRISRLKNAEEIVQELAEHIVLASGATSAAVYLEDRCEAVYRLSASVGSARFAQKAGHSAAFVSWLGMASAAAALPADLLMSVTTPALPAALGAPIRWRAKQVGFIVLGLEPSGADYTAEDIEFLTAVADQVAPAIVAARLSEAGVETRGLGNFDRFTAAVVHDLKNCVSAISMLARNATDNFADPEFQRDAVTTLSCTVDRMRRLLAKLSSPDAATPPSRTEPIDLRALIIEATTSLATDARIRLVRQLHPVNTVYGDRDALLRVVENLTTNAAEAIDREGTVTVTLAEEHGHAVISVADTGHGIPEEYRERHLFSPFRSTKKGGWGIGLFQTKQAVENQYGEIQVQSVEGHGTTFTVKLPLRADTESPSLESVR